MTPVPKHLAGALAGVDTAAASAQFHSDGELIAFPGLVPKTLLEALVRELPSRVRRRRLGWIRTAGTVGYGELQRRAPAITSLYQSDSLRQWLAAIIGKPLYEKARSDHHACAIYDYSRRGDRMTWHYDTCGCEAGGSYTVIVGLIDDSSQRLRVQLHRQDPKRLTEHHELRTPPGTVVLFCGSKAYHSVTALGAGQRRVVLSLAYATEPTMSLRGRGMQNLIDATLFFGPKSLLQWTRRLKR